MKSFQYLTILMVAIVTIEAQLWNDQQWRRWEWMTFNTGYCEPYPWCFDRSEEANGGIFKDCDVDGEIGLTWDELNQLTFHTYCTMKSVQIYPKLISWDME